MRSSVVSKVGLGILCLAVAIAACGEVDSSAQALAQARAALAQRHSAETVHILRAALRHQPQNPDLEIELGKAYVLEGKDGRALRIFRDVLRRDPSHREAKLELARGLGRRHDFQTSNQLYEELFDANAGDEAASLGYIHNLLAQNKTLEARHELNRALALHPNSLELQRYKDELDAGEVKLNEQPWHLARNRVQAGAEYFSDSAGNRSFATSQSLQYQVLPQLSNSLRMEERSLWQSGGAPAHLLTASSGLGWQLTPLLAVYAEGGAVRFSDQRSRALYNGELRLHPLPSLLMAAGFSRYAVVPTVQAADLDLLAEGWHAGLDWRPGAWQMRASWALPHYSDGNRGEREQAEVIRWIGNSYFAVGPGYRFRHLHYVEDPNHGYFSPGSYQSHLVLAGLRFRATKRFRAEYVLGAGAETSVAGLYQVAWEATFKNELLLRRWELGADYSYFDLAQLTGAFRANVAHLTLAYRF
jgi:tetratricopeptide (TPR) repeat protein